jgi:hypothetical protein
MTGQSRAKKKMKVCQQRWPIAQKVHSVDLLFSFCHFDFKTKCWRGSVSTLHSEYSGNCIRDSRCHNVILIAPSGCFRVTYYRECLNLVRFVLSTGITLELSRHDRDMANRPCLKSFNEIFARFSPDLTILSQDNNWNASGILEVQ